MFHSLTNLQIEQELGHRLKHRRLELNLSQDAVAEISGLGRRTVTAIENGEGSTLTTFIALFRALQALHHLEQLLPDLGPSPLMLAKLQEAPRKYSSRPRKTTPTTEWKWGDER